MQGPWDIAYHVRPWTTNWERTAHFRLRAKKVKEWRTAAFDLATEAKLPVGVDCIGVEVMAVLPTRAMQDNTACLPSYKAMQDGLVDYGLTEDDSPEYVKWTIFHAPVYKKGVAALWLRIHDLSDLQDDGIHISGVEMSYHWHGPNEAGRDR